MGGLYLLFYCLIYHKSTQRCSPFQYSNLSFIEDLINVFFGYVVESKSPFRSCPHIRRSIDVIVRSIVVEGFIETIKDQVVMSFFIAEVGLIFDIFKIFLMKLFKNFWSNYFF